MSTREIGPVHRDLFLGAVALALVIAPLWIPALGLDTPVHTYERAEVVIDGGGFEYADYPQTSELVPISDDVACSAEVFIGQVRTCSFERYLAENEPISTGISGDGGPYVLSERYDYVLLNGTTYEATYTERETEDGRTTYHLDNERAAPEAVLRDVAIDVDRDHLPDAVREAARSGEGRSRGAVEVPQTPIRVDDGTYYRVYEAGTDQTPRNVVPGTAARVVASIAGLALGYRVSRRIEVTHASDVDRD